MALFGNAEIDISQLPMADIAAWLELNPPQLPYSSLSGIPVADLTLQKYNLSQFAQLTPKEGQEVLLEVDVTNGILWRVRYSKLNADGSVKTSPYVWEASAGAAPLSVVGATCSATNASWIDFTGGAITIPRPGDYLIDYGAQVTGGNANKYIQCLANGAQVGEIYWSTVTGGSFNPPLVGGTAATGLPAGSVIKIQGLGGDTSTATFTNGFVRIRPIRIN